jgi:hypothetical protein
MWVVGSLRRDLAAAFILGVCATLVVSGDHRFIRAKGKPQHQRGHHELD